MEEVAIIGPLNRGYWAVRSQHCPGVAGLLAELFAQPPQHGWGLQALPPVPLDPGVRVSHNLKDPWACLCVKGGEDVTAMLTAGWESRRLLGSTRNSPEIDSETHLQGSNSLGKTSFDVMTVASCHLCPCVLENRATRVLMQWTFPELHTWQHPQGAKPHMIDATCRETLPHGRSAL